MKGVKNSSPRCRLCDRPAKARGLCAKHYSRWQRTGIAEATTRNTSGIIGDDVARFWHFVDKGPGCWLWTGQWARRDTSRGGPYGQIGIAGRMIAAHRYSYELHHGPIPDGMEIDHVKKRGCTSTLCVNPAHLEAVTPRENKQRTADDVCARGHALNEDNIYRLADGSNAGCLECRRFTAREYRRKVRQANIAAGLTSRGTPRRG